VELGYAERNTGADAELVLSVSLNVSEFGVEVVGLHGTYPDMFGDCDVEAAADGECKRGIVASGHIKSFRDFPPAQKGATLNFDEMMQNLPKVPH
jgi:hypothetical protein